MLPLKGKTVLITRAAEQTKDFIHQLQDLGATPISLPLITTTAIHKKELKDRFSANQCDWIIFTSTNAVGFFFDVVACESTSAKIAVVGEKTKRAVEGFGLKVDFMPAEFTAKKLANGLPLTKNSTVLIPRSDLAKNDIVVVLESRSCNVETIAIYKNSAIDYPKSELNKCFSQKIDYITFASGSAVTSFMDLGIKLATGKVVCIGPETAKVARKNKLKVAIVANPHTIDGMVEAILADTPN